MQVYDLSNPRYLSASESRGILRTFSFAARINARLSNVSNPANSVPGCVACLPSQSVPVTHSDILKQHTYNTTDVPIHHAKRGTSTRQCWTRHIRFIHTYKRMCTF